MSFSLTNNFVDVDVKSASHSSEVWNKASAFRCFGSLCETKKIEQLKKEPKIASSNYLKLPTDLWIVINEYACERSFRDLPLNFTANIETCPSDLIYGRADAISDLLRRAKGDVTKIMRQNSYVANYVSNLVNQARQCLFPSNEEEISPLSAETFLASRGTIRHLILDFSYCTAEKIEKILEHFHAIDTVIIENSLRITQEAKKKLITSGIDSTQEWENGLIFEPKMIQGALTIFANHRIQKLEVEDICLYHGRSNEFMKAVAQIHSLTAFRLHLSYAHELEESLRATNDSLSTVNCENLSALAACSGLKKLTLGSNYGLYLDSIPKLIRCGLLGRLEVLSFDYKSAPSSGTITDDYLEMLVPHCPNVVELVLAGHPRITDRALFYLETLGCLTVLNLQFCTQVSTTAIFNLMDKLPNLAQVIMPNGTFFLKSKAQDHQLVLCEQMQNLSLCIPK